MMKSTYNPGFSLIEAIIASMIILFGVVSLLSLTVSSNIAGTTVREEYVARTLAQEGIEAARSVRDANWELRQQDSTHAWDNGLHGTSSDYTAALVLFDPSTNPANADDGWFVFDACDALADACARIFAQENGPFFQTPSGTSLVGAATPFSRLVTLTPICRDVAGNEAMLDQNQDQCPAGTTHVGIDVVVDVAWSSRTGGQQTTLEEHLYDWQ